MATLTIDDVTARKIYPSAAPELKAILDNSYTKGFFSTKITERVFSFEDACRETGRDPNDRFFSECRPHENAVRKIEYVAEVLNEGVKLSYKNSNQEKWRVYVVWDDKIASFRLSAVFYGHPGTHAGLGSRTAFANRGLAEHFAKYFMPLINESLS